MSRINHANEAEALLIAAAAFTSSDMQIQTGEQKADMLAEAQVHAALALVEQQQIANLIALANTSGTDVLSPCEQAAWSALGDPDSGPLLPDIAAALGIEVLP